MMKFLLSFFAFVGIVAGQVPGYGQCGGMGYSGATNCVNGYQCSSANAWYYQCVPGTQTSTPVSVPTTFTSRTVTTTTSYKPVTTTSTSKTATSTTTTKPAPTDGSKAVRYLGRVNPATKELTWPGTGISFTFVGTSATIGLASLTGTNSVALTVDGGKATIISNVVGNSISTPSGLSYGTHTVVLRKRSEANFGSIVIGSVTTDGTFATDVAPKRQIEVIGDSITVGYGLDGTTATCTNTAALEDNPLTYSVLAAQSLNADYNIVAWSGKGLTRNYAQSTPDTSPLMPELYTRYGANDADNSYTFPSTWSPSAVVINLGTNDFSYLNVRSPLDASAFTSAMVKFVQSIQTHYPTADFFLLTSPMLSDSYPTAADAQKTTQTNALKAAIAKIGSKAHLVDWPTQGSDVGCDYHPNAATHAAEAKVLAAAISSVLKW